MKQATLVIVCAAIWLLALATSQAQEKPSTAKAPAGVSAPAKPAPAKATPSQPAVKPAVATQVPPQPAAKPPVAAKPSAAMLRVLAGLGGQGEGPTVDDICDFVWPNCSLSSTGVTLA